MPRIRAILIQTVFLLASCAHRQGKIISKVNDVFHVIFNKEQLANLPERRLDSALSPFIPQFLDDAKKRGVIIPQETVDMLRQLIYVDQLSTAPEPGVMAVCTRYYADEYTYAGPQEVKWMNIEVQRAQSLFYTEGNPKRLQELIYHELFHCFLNKGHLPLGVPGIMGSSLSKGSDRIFVDWNGLVDEMFSPKYLQMIPNAS